MPRLAISFALLALALPLLAADKRPNILFIYSDDHSHRSVSCYPEAHPWVRTPHIDSLAENGVRFTHATIGTWCMPSRATMLTGHLQFGVESMRMEGKYPGSTYDPEKCRFWPSVFRKNGYTTAQIGKWHTGTDTGYGRDWDYQKVWNRPRHTGNAGKYYYDQLIETNGGEAVMTPGYSTDNYTDWALEFLEGEHRDADQPWYLWLCYGAVHGPFTPAERHLDEYPGAEVAIPADIYPPRPGKPTYANKWDEWEPGPDGVPYRKGGSKQKTVRDNTVHGESLHDWERQYNQAVLAIDEGVGRLLEALEKTGQRENTLIVFTTDQGFAWGQHGFRRKLAPYDANIRSPLIVNFPGHIAEGAVCEHPVGGPSIPPTFFAFAGIDLPWEMHGSDLTPLLKNPDADWDEPVLMALTGQSYGSDTDTIPSTDSILKLSGVPWWVSLTEGRFKYIRTLVAGEPDELYDLKSDPEELQNLAQSPDHYDRVETMRASLTAELKKRGAGFADSMPAIGQPK